MNNFLVMSERYTILFNQRASKWYHKTLSQSAQIARKEFNLSYQLWNLQKKIGAIRYHKQILVNNCWHYTVNNQLLK